LTSIIWEPISFIWSIVAHLTALRVQTGIKIGVCISPCAVFIVHARASPSVALSEKEKELYIYEGKFYGSI